MQYSFVKSLLEGSWMVTPGAASAYYPLFKGALSGLQFVKEPEPENSLPFFRSSSSDRDVAFSNYSAVSKENQDEKFVFVLNMRGTILKHDADCGPVGSRTLANRLLNADSSDAVIGHILVTESGGGQAAAVPELADAIKSLTKPIVAWIDGMSGSAAYYINSYCNHIMASRATDEVGCIGTLIQMHGFPKFSKLEDGSVYARIYADEATEKNDEYETALEGNFTLVKERLLNPLNEQFKSDVKTNRSMVLEEQLKGRTYTASEVVGTLIDSIGTFQDAVNTVISLAEPIQKKQPKTNNTKQMKELTSLNKVKSVAGFETADGQASFNEEQLTEIDQELESGATAIDRVAVLEGENATLTANAATQGARVTELETALAAALGDGSADPAQVIIETDGKTTPKKDGSMASAFEACESHFKQFS